jgi:hypothetical protein
MGGPNFTYANTRLKVRFEVGKLYTCLNPDCKLHLLDYDPWDENQNFCTGCGTPLQNVGYDGESKLDVEHERLTDAIGRFSRSAHELQNMWSQVSERTNDFVNANEGYPFQESFEDTVAKIESVRWRRAPSGPASRQRNSHTSGPRFRFALLRCPF